MGAHHSREIISKEKRRRKKTNTTTNSGSDLVFDESSPPLHSSTHKQAHVGFDDSSVNTKLSHPESHGGGSHKGINSSTPASPSPIASCNPVSPVRHQVVLSDHIMPLSSLVSIARHTRQADNKEGDNENDKQNITSSQKQNYQDYYDTVSAASDEEESPTNPSISSRSAFYTSSLDSSSSAHTSLTQPSSILYPRRLSLNTNTNRSSIKTNSKASNSSRSSNSGPMIFDITVNSTDPIPSSSPDGTSYHHQPQQQQQQQQQQQKSEHHYSNRRVRKSSWVYDCSHEKEYNRQLREHYVLKQVFGKNALPVLDPAPQHILDSACGIGLWAWEVSQQYSNSDVIGIDINLPDQHSGPWGSTSTTTNTLNYPAHMTAGTHSSSLCDGKNISFIHVDVLAPLPFDNDYFGYIHQRGAGTFVPFDYWETLLREFHRILKMDGVLQLVEHDILFKNPGPVLSMINEWYRIASDGIGVKMGYNQVMKEKLLSAGFDQVEEQVYDIPIGEWSDDPVKKQHGFLYKEQVKALFKSVQRWWLAETGITQLEYDRVCSEAMDEFENYNSSVTWIIFTARKSRPNLTTSGPASSSKS